MKKDLKYFVRRSAVLKLYRGLLRATRKLGQFDQGLARDGATQVRREFRIAAKETNGPTIAMLIREGEKQLDALRELYDIRTRYHRNMNSIKSETGAWKGRVNDDGSDERGRVGDKWPWE